MDSITGTIKAISEVQELKSGAKIMKAELEMAGQSKYTAINLTIMGELTETAKALKLPAKVNAEFELLGKLNNDEDNDKVTVSNTIRAFTIQECSTPTVPPYYEMTGTISEISPLRKTSIGGRFQDFIIERNGVSAAYAKAKVSLEGELIDQLKDLKVGDRVKVMWRPKGNRFQVGGKTLISNKVCGESIELISEQ